MPSKYTCLGIVGDSQLNRMLEQDLFYDYQVTDWTEPGATTEQILVHIKKQCQQGNKAPRNSLGILWIGTNDVLQNKHADFHQHFKQLVKFLKKVFKKLIFVLLPPILAFPEKTDTIKKMNKTIESYRRENVCLVDIAFCYRDEVIREEYYEPFTECCNFVDDIHLNSAAYRRISSVLQNFFSK
uniref:Uncharacterized protein n=1 Tax=Cacopsylla melanoneura TaxID=428564 RepID=A0A8D9AYN3_9HEMI